MASITTRAGKGSPLTNNELDANFNNLNAGLAAAAITSGTIDSVAVSNSTVNATTIGATDPSTGRFTQVNVVTQGDLRLEDTTGGQYVALQAPGTVSVSYTLTLPTADGTSGQVLATDGAGQLSFTSASGGGISTGKAIAMAMIFGF
jgi:hypothetical protein